MKVKIYSDEYYPFYCPTHLPYYDAEVELTDSEYKKVEEVLVEFEKVQEFLRQKVEDSNEQGE